MNLKKLDISRVSVKYHGRLVGTLAMEPNGRACTFQYAREWLADGFSIAPLELPLRDVLFVAKEEPFRGNFGIFEDSLPDGYGRYLLHKVLAGYGIDSLSLNPLQWLSIVGSSGMGALCYEPVFEINTAYEQPSLDDMQRMALDVLSERSSGDEDVLYFNSGNFGGCRPKCLYADSDGHWLVKFRHTYDPKDMGEMEYRYAVAAKECGICMPEFKLIDGRYFATKRFDIDADGNRLHTATAAALLRESIRPPMTDYKTLLQLTGFMTQSVQQVAEMFRRMAFNVFAQNKDDHAKNFTFIYDKDRWMLAPAYDLTYAPEGYHGEHATSANYSGNPTEEDMLAVGKAAKLSASLCRQIIDEVREKTAALID